jgi:hypothetical protein
MPDAINAQREAPTTGAGHRGQTIGVFRALACRSSPQVLQHVPRSHPSCAGCINNFLTDKLIMRYGVDALLASCISYRMWVAKYVQSSRCFGVCPQPDNLQSNFLCNSHQTLSALALQHLSPLPLVHCQLSSCHPGASHNSLDIGLSHPQPPHLLVLHCCFRSAPLQPCRA